MFEREDFLVAADGRSFTVTLLSPPPEQLAAEPALLMSFASGREKTLFEAPCNHTTDAFLAAGHRVLSFDYTGHGERIDHFGEGIHALRNSLVVGGVDPFAIFAADAGAVIDACLRRGVAAFGRIAVSGTSRGGYLALYLLAHEARLTAAAGFAPVTDWRVLSEFAADVQREEVGGLALVHYAADMVGRPVFMSIGNDDARVGTKDCVALRNALKEVGAEVECILTDDAGHTMGVGGYKRGADFLLCQFAAADQ